MTDKLASNFLYKMSMLFKNDSWKIYKKQNGIIKMMESINILQLQQEETSSSIVFNSYHPEKMKNPPSSRPSLMAYSSLVVKKNDVEEDTEG